MREKKMREEKMLSQSAVLSMGFTKSMIDKLLPPPILKRNPHYASAAPVKLWREADVLAVMQTREYCEMAEKAASRKQAAKKAVKTKAAKAESIADDLIASIRVKRWDMAELERVTLSAKQQWFYDHGDFEALTPDRETLERWMVNFIRHNLCEYDDKLDGLFGLVGREGLYERLKAETLLRISQVYPELESECKRQSQS